MIENFALEVFSSEDCPQNSPQWHQARAGIPTSSEFSTIMAKGRGGGESKTRKTYLYKLAAERISGQVGTLWAGNIHTERGHALEPEARALYALMNDVDPKQVGFVRRGPIGCSPDSLVGEPGLLEIKTRLGHLQIEVLESGVLPLEHKAQVQGQMWVTDREWVDYFSYSPGLPHFQIRVYREPVYIAEMAKAVKDFCDELEALTERLSKMQVAA